MRHEISAVGAPTSVDGGWRARAVRHRWVVVSCLLAPACGGHWQDVLWGPSREAHEIELLHGRIDADRLPRLLDAVAPADTVDEWFLCGPFAMVEQARATLRGLDVPRQNVHFELFHVDGRPPAPAPGPTATPTDASMVTIVLGGRSSTFPLAADAQGILDAALTVRADTPYACKGGVCGTCRARLVRGEVAMDQNYALEPDEVAAGFVLACQSHPVSAEVVLSFDQ